METVGAADVAANAVGAGPPLNCFGASLGAVRDAVVKGMDTN
jgi:hypothetical protein